MRVLTMWSSAVVLAVFAGTGLGPLARGAPIGAKAHERHIDELIRQLGHREYRVREEATRKLAEIGLPAVPALRRAMHSDDPEVRHRARRAYAEILTLTPEQLKKRRRAAYEAFIAADYRRMIRCCQRVAGAENASFVDWLWLGHACQLAGRWRGAVTAYDAALALLETVAVPRVGPAPPWPRTVARAWGAAIGPQQRANLLLWVARILMAELNDPKGAGERLARAAQLLENVERGASYLRHCVLTELPAARQAGGDLRGAIRSWWRFRRACGPLDLDAVKRVGEIVSRMPPGEAPPPLPSVILLTPARPAVKLVLKDPKARERSFRKTGNLPHDPFAFVPPPGKEFAAFEFTCDVERLEKSRYPGRFVCFAAPGHAWANVHEFGAIAWPEDKAPGRGVLSTRIKIPPGLQVVHIGTWSHDRRFKVHSVQVKATFRPAAKHAKPLPPVPRSYVRVDALPKGGTLTFGGKPLGPWQSRQDVRPGNYRVRYEIPGRARKFAVDVTVAPSRQYELLANLDSPFRWTQAGPSALSFAPPARASIARLPDGSHLAAWCRRGGKIMLSRSRDLVGWTEAEPLPFNSVFANVAPATFTAADGTLHLAYFSRRLYLLDPLDQGYVLWLTSTRDGRKWTTLRPVSIPAGLTSGPVGAAQMLRGPDRRYWLFWRHYAAAGKAIGEIRELRRIEVTGGLAGLRLRNQHVSIDGRARFHMVFDNVYRAVSHTTSEDGLTWAEPTVLVPPSRGRQVCHAQLIHGKGKALLLCELDGRGYLRPLWFPTDPIDPRGGVKITNHVVPLSGSRATVTQDGEVLLLAGSDTSWLLRAKLEKLLAMEPGEP